MQLRDDVSAALHGISVFNLRTVTEEKITSWLQYRIDNDIFHLLGSNLKHAPEIFVRENGINRLVLTQHILLLQVEPEFNIPEIFFQIKHCVRIRHYVMKAPKVFTCAVIFCIFFSSNDYFIINVQLWIPIRAAQ